MKLSRINTKGILNRQRKTENKRRYMQQQKLINKILKAIEEKQKNEEFGTIIMSFQGGFINDVDDKRTRKI